ncbi:MAG: hydrolase [Microbacteriaceae bacterium]|nr:hydrolase [Microbacteriaceae bacterium]
MLLFIFDMDDVLYEYDWRTRMAGVTELTGLPLEQLRERWWHEHGERAAEAGAFGTAEEYLAAVESALEVTIDEEHWVRLRAAAMTPTAGSIAAVARAAQLGQVTLLTNNGSLPSKHLRVMAPELVPIFGDHLFTSSDYGARKPDPIVFRAVLDRYEVDAADAFFADDMAINVEGARTLGITAHHFQNPEGLLAAIEEFAATRVTR